MNTSEAESYGPEDPWQEGDDPWNTGGGETHSAPARRPGPGTGGASTLGSDSGGRTGPQPIVYATSSAPATIEPPAQRIIHDVPPAWNGKSPETQADPYLKLLAAWIATRTLKTQRGMTLAQRTGATAVPRRLRWWSDVQLHSPWRTRPPPAIFERPRCRT